MIKYIGLFIIFMVLFPVVSLVGIGKKEKAGESLLSKDDSRYIRGFATCGVFLAHTESYMEEFGMPYVSIMRPFSIMGGVGVLLFFFVSGYGLWKAYSCDMDCIKYWKKRIFNTYLPAVIIETVFAVESLSRLENWSVSSFFYAVFISCWFIDVIMIEYVIFFLSYLVSKLFHNSKTYMLIIIYITDILIAVLFLLCGFEARWYNGLLLFPVGMSVALHENFLMRAIRKQWWAWFSAFLTIFLGLGIVFCLNKGALWADFIKTLSGVALSLLFAIIMQKLKLGNKAMFWIGDRSLYVYLVHIGFLEIVFYYTRAHGELDFMPYAIPVLLLVSIAVSGIFEKIISFAFSKVRKSS